MKDEVITPEERALGAFLSAMYDQRLDGTKMREAMLKVLGIAAPKALEPVTHTYELELPDGDNRKAAVHWVDRKQGEAGETHHHLCISVDAAPKALEHLTEHLTEDVSYATTVMALIEDYAKSVHDGDDNSCTVLRRTIKASLEQPPKAMEPTILKPLTPCVCHDETAKRYCKDKGKCSFIEAHGITKGTP